jgi:hypothetical protein
LETKRKQKQSAVDKKDDEQVFQCFWGFQLSNLRLLRHNPLVMTSESGETIQEIAYKLMLEQNKNDKILNGPTERTIFVLGSKGVVSFSVFSICR